MVLYAIKAKFDNLKGKMAELECSGNSQVSLQFFANRGAHEICKCIGLCVVIVLGSKL